MIKVSYNLTEMTDDFVDSKLIFIESNLIVISLSLKDIGRANFTMKFQLFITI
jgi:hypothetical protein